MIQRTLAFAALLFLASCARYEWAHPEATAEQRAMWELRCHQMASQMMPGVPTRPASTPVMRGNNDLAFLSTALSNTQMQIAATPRVVTDRRAFALCMKAGGFVRKRGGNAQG